ncbi:hypothetical protein L202_04088 [Cryptococcus amylolentus CBS 6039]|uniref:Spindle pole body component n=1 Tax=Cryptococcus amylolentus CBS 6039 TaxID=1295533 RepID=A0A1E3HQ09_9TREE|nr:hypothetical protein L202_04088 [Cryptococcus amylolentus CBS 6039]ODN78453.1 hypothetical protein L202_04088 [Cryptococcus amylolentus CBS 6039]
MLAEVLLVLGGHPSSLFVPHPPQAAVPKTYQVSPALCEYLHPGEISSLNSLASLAFQYTQVKKWAASTLKLGREAVLAESLYSSRKGKQRQPEDSGLAAPDQYLSTLAASTLEVLSEYDLLIVETEARILSFDGSLVQDQQGYVPLTSIVATFDKWIAPIASLKRMVDQLSSTEYGDWTPGRIIDLVHEKTQTGNPFLKAIFTSLSNSLRHVFLTHLVSFILYGIAPTLSTPTSPAIGLDIGADPLSPQHRAFALNEELLPSSMQGKTKESILYVGRVAATLKREGRSLPKQLVSGLREHIMSVKWLEEGEDLGEAIEKARAEVGEWLWKHILTGTQVAESIETLGNFFLLRKADYAISTIREISQLRLDKLITSNPHSSSSVIREQDLDLALRRASVGTSAGQDAGLDKLRYKMEKGPLRAILPSLPPKVPRKGGADRSGDGLSDGRSNIRQLFSSSLLGTPLTLTTTITWPLDLFMTPLAISTYSDIQSYLTAIRHTHLAVLSCWTSLSAAQRQRRKWTGVTEGGTPEEADARKWLARTAWGTVRLMLFFIDQLQSHFMTDIIDVQHRRLLEQLEVDNVSSSTLDGSMRGSMRGSVRGSVSRTAPTPVKSAAASTVEGRRPASPYTETQGLHDSQSIRANRAPPTPSKKQGPSYLDFLTLRQIHTRHLAFLREALLISDIGIATLTRDILDTCRRFTGLVERWGGDVLPELLMEGIEGEEVGKMVQERAQAVEEINEALHEHLTDFFGALLETQQPGASDPDRSTTGGGSLSRTMRVAQISRMMSRQTSLTAAAMNNVNKGAKSKVQLEKEEKGLEAEAAMARHIEQLLLRLDFNGVLTAWRLKETDGEYMGSVLVEGGL